MIVEGTQLARRFLSLRRWKMSSERQEVLKIMRGLMAMEYRTEAEVDEAVSRLESLVVHPAPISLIYYSHEYFDHDPSPEEVVDKIFEYRPFEL
jgi:hypothetical protein